MVKVLVTGGAGFIGSWIAKTLALQGNEVTVYDNFSSGTVKNLEGFEDCIKIIHGDILDTKHLWWAFKEQDLISHQAAQLEIEGSLANPTGEVKQNIVGTLNVLEAAAEKKIKKVVYASSACVYGQINLKASNELYKPRPNWPHGVSKFATELYADVFSRYRKMDTVGLRYSIVYGPYEWYGRVITMFLKRALLGESPVIFGVGEQVRDFIYVGDAVRAHNMAMFKETPGSWVFNVGTGTGTSINELAGLVEEITGVKAIREEVSEGEKSKLVEGRTRLPLELKRMVLDIEHIKFHLGWEPSKSLFDGLCEEWDWLQLNPDRWEKIRL